MKDRRRQCLVAFEEVFLCALLNNHWRLQCPAIAFVPVLNVALIITDFGFFIKNQVFI
ncbi:hypothetical protein STEG23_019459, partial [Scotinomys teguina]